VYLATSTHKQADYFTVGPTAYSFFVVVQNVQKVAYKAAWSASGWYDCLRFTITTGSGKTYSVTPGEGFSWSANPEETWLFPSGGMRVFLVDFNHGVWDGLGVWVGLPPTPSEPEVVTMTVTFDYPDSKGKLISVTSRPTDVYLCSSSFL
jgi:hypothetical protein